MTTQASKDITYVLVDGLNIAAGLETLEHKVTAVTVQKQALGETWPTTVDTGTRKGELTVAGWLDSVMMTPASGGKVNTISTTSSIVSAFVNGNTVSERALVFQAANVVGIGIFTAPEDIAKMTPEFSVAGECGWAFIAVPYAARTTDGNTDSAYGDLTAQAATGHAVLHVGAYTGGATKCVVKLRHSSDHITFAAHTTFADVTAIGAEVKALASACERYVSAEWAWTGGTNPSISFAVLVVAD